ncbi:coat protein, partial [Pseudomonas aeruginosa]|nr:coat protein [Pseudomonas aeruginosa]
MGSGDGPPPGGDGGTGGDGGSNPPGGDGGS